MKNLLVLLLLLLLLLIYLQSQDRKLRNAKIKILRQVSCFIADYACGCTTEKYHGLYGSISQWPK